MIPIVGFLAATDERVESTVRAIERHLADDRGLVYRDQEADPATLGFAAQHQRLPPPGSRRRARDEGRFLLCTFC